MSPSNNQPRTYVSYIVTDCKYTFLFLLLHKISLSVYCDSERITDISFGVPGRSSPSPRPLSIAVDTQNLVYKVDSNPQSQSASAKDSTPGYW